MGATAGQACLLIWAAALARPVGAMFDGMRHTWKSYLFKVHMRLGLLQVSPRAGDIKAEGHGDPERHTGGQGRAGAPSYQIAWFTRQMQWSPLRLLSNQEDVCKSVCTLMRHTPQ